jgi:hypothetical protein
VFKLIFEMMKTTKKHKEYQFIFLAIVFGLIVSLCALELMVRVFTNQGLMNRYAYPKGLFANNFGEGDVGVYFTPNFKGEFAKGEISGLISINSKGCRDYEREYERQGKFRILALGDSFTFGHGVEFEESFLTILETSLNLKKDSFEILKCALPGGGPKDYLRFLKQEGYKYNPDLVMVNFFIGNDVITDSYVLANSTKKGNNKAPSAKGSLVRKIKDFLAKNSQFYGLLVNRIKNQPRLLKFFVKYGFGLSLGLSDTGVLDIMKKHYSEREEKYWGWAFQLLEEIQKLSKNLLVVALPSREQYELTLRESTADRLGYDLKDFDTHVPNKKLGSFLKKQKIYKIDLLNAFEEHYKISGTPLNFQLDPHWNRDGHKFVASVLFDEISPILDKLVNKQ